MTRLTETQGLVAPTRFDAAALALDLRRLAIAGDALFDQLSNWSDFTTWQWGSGDVGSQVIVRNLQTGTFGPFTTFSERIVQWSDTQFNNTAIPQPTPGDLVLPDQDENRFWWWVGGAY
ncbi:hypothetical protein, partial [Micromonospora sp. NPDC049645]|uniref:hypothetical protein n=1 Tax=Micromonospora sp. NPDC049645 TaxID=3155508 RepID=UPI003449C0E0